MPDIRFAWDDAKAHANQRKHGVAFAEAVSVFLDENALLLDDPDHSVDEDRFVLLGISARLRVLIVCHCYREDRRVVRIISARRATRREQNTYVTRNQP